MASLYIYTYILHGPRIESMGVIKQWGELSRMQRERLKQIIEAGEFNQLIGEIEGPELECKKEHYKISTASSQHDSNAQKIELAKDVSALANSAGGFILIGVETRTSQTSTADEICAICPFPESKVDCTQYKNILADWIYPQIEGLDVRWITTNKDKSKGVVVIEIPLQSQSFGPFLICRSVEDGRRLEKWFGLAVRKGDTSPPAGVHDLQNYVRAGMHYQQLLESRLDGLEVLLRDNISRVHEKEVRKHRQELISKRVNRALQDVDMQNNRAIILTAYPEVTSELKTIFSSDEDSIRKKLEHPPVVRRMGWSLETEDRAKIKEGQFVRVTNGQRKIIDLYRDGTLVFAGLADGNFLARGNEGSVKLNPLAQIELVYLFAKFYMLVIEDFVQTPQEVRVGLEYINMRHDGTPSRLSPYGTEYFGQTSDEGGNAAPEDKLSHQGSYTVADFCPEAIAYDLVREVYHWYEYDESMIPYRTKRDSSWVVDVDAIARLGQ